MSKAIIRFAEGVARNADGVLRIDWSIWPSSFTVNAANVGYTVVGGPDPVGFFLSQAINKSVVPGYFKSCDTTPVHPLGFKINTTLSLVSVGSFLVWQINFGMASGRFVKVRKTVLPTDVSPVGEYSYYSSFPAVSEAAYRVDGPYTVSA